MPSVITSVRGTSNCSSSARRFASRVSESERASRAWPRMRSISTDSEPTTNAHTASSVSISVSASRSGA